MPLRTLTFASVLLPVALVAPAMGEELYVLPSTSAADDSNAGDLAHPWRTLGPANAHTFKPGDILRLEGGAVFQGGLTLTEADSGSATAPVLLTSTTSLPATLASGTAVALDINHAVYVTIGNLKLQGPGRKSGSQSDGFRATSASHLHLDGLEVSGFQHNGLVFIDCSHIRALRINSHDNGNAGIQAYGSAWNDPAKYGQDFYFGYCRTDNNPGDPTVLLNHSGNGLLLGQVNGALVEYCEASNNGWDMPNQNSNGPAGIWTWQSDNVVIQHCISHSNKTASGKGDGDGFDFDGGVRNSTLQYCLSYGNQGPGFLLFQGDWATTWSNNTVHHCVSVNDGNPNGNASLLVWHEGGNMSGAVVHHNTFWNTDGEGSSVAFAHPLPGGLFVDNLFVSSDATILGVARSASTFLGNRYWRPAGSFLCDGDTSLQHWATLYSQETYNGTLLGTFGDPGLQAPLAFVGLEDPAQLPFWRPFSPAPSSPCLAPPAPRAPLPAFATAAEDIAGHLTDSPHLGAYSDTVDHDRRLLNVSTRAHLGSGNSALIGGFVITGSRTKRVLLRAAGPGLAQFLPDETVAASPTLELHRSEGSRDELLGTSAAWSSSTALQTSLEEAFGLCGAFQWDRSSLDSALEADLPPGNYTTVLSAGAGNEGLALVEVYEEGVLSAGSRLVNLSTRSWVGNGGEAQIAGFVVAGSEPQRFLIRAAGPSLGAFLDPLSIVANPHLTVTQTSPGSDGGTWSNDDWNTFPNDTPSIEDATALVGAFAFQQGSKDAALLITLNPGSYTATVTPEAESEGVGLVEVYQLP